LRQGHVAIQAALIIGSAVMAFPFVYGALGALSSLTDYERAGLLLIPHHLSLVSNLQAVLSGVDFWVIFRNTALRALWYGFWPSLLALLSGYAIARLRFPGRRVVFILLLSGLMVPQQTTTVPTFLLMSHWPLVGGNNLQGQGGTGMIDTWGALLLLGLISGFEMFLIKQAIEQIPYEYEEAARMDGAGVLRIIFTLYAPMLKAPLATLTLINMINIWNDYYTPLIFTPNNAAITTLSLGMTNYASSLIKQANGIPPYPLLFMGATVAMLPTIIIFLFFQRYIVL